MTGDTHYDMEILAELAEGLLDGATAARVREHLAVCDPCGESLADLAAVREMLAGVPVPAMPMGVALRIDKALGAEAETRRSGGGLKLDEAPDWDRIMADSPWEAMPDSPWETAPEPPLTVGEPPLRAVPAVAAVEEPPRPSAPEVPEPQEVVRLGVVADDGTVVPARRRKASRRRSWQLPAVASAAAAVVIGVAGVSAGLLSATGTEGGAGKDSYALPVPTTTAPGAEPSKDVPTTGPAHPGRKYVIASSDFNYSDTVLRGPLNTYVGAYGPGSTGDESSDPAVMRCITRISEQVGDQLGLRKNPNPIGVDQAFYEGSEATVMAFWKNRLHNAVWVYVVDDNCRNMRPPSVSRWQ